MIVAEVLFPLLDHWISWISSLSLSLSLYCIYITQFDFPNIQFLGHKTSNYKQAFLTSRLNYFQSALEADIVEVQKQLD